MTERRVLVGYLTPCGADAAELGRVLGEITDARPVVASVLPWPHYLMNEEDERKALDRTTGASFAAVEERFFKGMDPLFEAVTGRSAAERLQELALEHRAETIVVGSAHRGPIGRTLAGSTGAALLHGAPCAVAIAPRGFAEREQTRLQRIAVAFNGSSESWSALNAGISIAEAVHANLTVLIVTEPPHYGYSEVMGVLSAQGLHSAEEAEGRRLADLALGRVPAHVEADHRELTGGAGHLLAEASADFDLIVCGSRGWGPLRRTLLGSTSTTLISRAECPVLVLPRGAPLDHERSRAGRTPSLVSS